MVSRRKRARLRYLRKWYDRYILMNPENYDVEGRAPEVWDDIPLWHLLEAGSEDLEQHVIEARILESEATICVRNGFCSECQLMLDNWLALETLQSEDQPHSLRQCHTISLEAAARSGCQLCACLLQTLRDCDYGEMLGLYRRIERRLEILEARSTSSLVIGNWGTLDARSLKMTLPGIDYPRGWVPDIAFDIQDGTLVAQPGSGIAETENCVLPIVNRWIETCDRDHDDCTVRQSVSLPTRLISVCGSTIRLESSERWHTKPPYATLSYCWGGLDFIKTTTSNFHEFLENIPHDQLPQTFQDAVRITRTLGIDYIWIDALCIIQDSDSDWRKESSRMSEVYGNSHINIAASSATDPGQGCFTKDPYMRDALETRVAIAGKEYKCEFHGLWSSYSHAVSDSHLSTRAWALQEKLLPARTIHIGDRGAFWECRSSVGLECLPRFRESPRLDTSLAALMNNLAKATKLEVFTRWKLVVETYSTAKLTVSRGRLPGIAGIAKHFGKLMRCEYLAGIWRDDTFDAQLCWCSFEPCSRPIWRAPTWSWASTDGRTSFSAYGIWNMRPTHVVWARTLEASITRVSEAEFGEVSAGWIRITCSYVLQGKFEDVPGKLDPELCLDGLSCRPLTVNLDCTNDTNTQKGEVAYVLPFTATTVEPVHQDLPAEREDVRGLVLQRTGRVPGEFRRVGFFRCGTSIYDPKFIYDSVEGRTNWNQFIGLMRGQGADMAKEVCTEMIDDSKYGTGGFVITIV